jgi:probable F420-dependent oxidoreductase
MKIGLGLPVFVPAPSADGTRRQASATDIRDAALRAEELGFDSIWTCDHIMVRRDEPLKYNSIYEGLTTLAWVAGQTSSIELGISILVLTMRNPIQVAKEMATIDALAGGRTVLGVAAGWSEPEFSYLGVPWERRGARLEESIAVLRSLWQRANDPFEGSLYSFSEHSFAPPPARPGGPPIWVGGDSLAAQRRAARIGDAWHGGVRMSALERFEAAAREVRAHANGRRVELTTRGRIGESAQWEHPRAAPAGWPGGEQFIIGQGTAAVEHLTELAKLGCSYVVLDFWESFPDNHLEAIEAFAHDVLPAVQSLRVAVPG